MTDPLTAVEREELNRAWTLRTDSCVDTDEILTFGFRAARAFYRSVEPSDEEVEAAAKAIHMTYLEGSTFLADFEEDREQWEREARAALLAAHNPSPEEERND